MKYIIEERLHNNGAKTYIPFIIKEGFFGLSNKKYPIRIKGHHSNEDLIKNTGLHYDFYDLDE